MALMIKGLVACLFKKQLNFEILRTTKELMSTKPRPKSMLMLRKERELAWETPGRVKAVLLRLG